MSPKCLIPALCVLVLVPVVIIPTRTNTSLAPRPSASAETASGEQNVMRMQSNSVYTYVDKLSLHFIHHHTIVKLSRSFIISDLVSVICMAFFIQWPALVHNSWGQ